MARSSTEKLSLGARLVSVWRFVVGTPDRYRYKARGIATEIVGYVGYAATDLNPTGSVIVRGELYPARVSDSKEISRGERVKIISAQGHQVEVVAHEMH